MEERVEPLEHRCVGLRREVHGLELVRQQREREHTQHNRHRRALHARHQLRSKRVKRSPQLLGDLCAHHAQVVQVVTQCVRVRLSRGREDVAQRKEEELLRIRAHTHEH